jgi:hypothetical protein
LLTHRLPVKSPWLTWIEPRWVHAKRGVCEPDGELTPRELRRRLCTHFETSSFSIQPFIPEAALGKVRYQEYQRNADRSRSRSAPIEWFDGQHEALIPQDLFDQCQEARKHRAAHRQATPRYNPYLLRNLVYCCRCCTSAPTENPFLAFGKMRSQA